MSSQNMFEKNAGASRDNLPLLDDAAVLRIAKRSLDETQQVIYRHFPEIEERDRRESEERHARNRQEESDS